MPQLPNPLARIALRGDFPRELIRLLSSLRLDPFGAGGLDADLVAAFAGQKDGGWMLHLRPILGVSAATSGVLCANAYVAASILLSHILGLEEPFLAASEPTYATLREVIELAASPANVLIEGETGTGKRSLAELINRASGHPDGVVRIDCAVAADVARIVGTTRSREDIAQTGVVLLDHLAELPRDAHAALANVMGKREMRFLATSRLPIRRMVEEGAFTVALQSKFDVSLQILPLNCRRTDIEVLARHFLRNENPSLQLDSTALTALRHYRFAGNVRELRNMMIRVAICEGDGIARAVDRSRIEGHFGNPSAQSSLRPDSTADRGSGEGRKLRLISSTDGARKRRREGTEPFPPATLKLAESRS